MSETRTYGGLDAFRLAAAFLVAAIHTSPLEDLSPTADFFLTRVLARVAVPFFFMAAGHFVLARWQDGAIRRYCRKLLKWYGLAVFLYLPLGLYAGHYQDLTPAGVLRLLIFDGTFYHLWYFPGCVAGILTLVLLKKHLPEGGLLPAAGALYLLGLLGDSYYGLTLHVPGLAQVYDGLFQVFSYTRNGLFFAPLFLLLGARLGQENKPEKMKPWAVGFCLSLAAITAEGFFLRNAGWQRHDSMYLFLPLCMVCLYRLLLAWERPAAPRCRSLSTGIYLLHPAMIVTVRGTVKLFPFTAVLVENSLVHYIAVCLLSLGCAWAGTLLLKRLHRRT